MSTSSIVGWEYAVAKIHRIEWILMPVANRVYLIIANYIIIKFTEPKPRINHFKNMW